jgi:predicted Zn finger-like uncharacterized protein
MPNLAARCTACGTVFRVVQDQLRVAGGLVRCGRCGEVFNAAEALIDLETSAPVAAPAEQPPEPEQQAGTAFDLHVAPDPRQASPEPEAGPDAPIWADEPPSAAEPLPDLRAETAGFDVEPARDSVAISAPAAAGSTDTSTPHEAHDADPRAEADDRPSFVRSAERAQRWRQPRVRTALAAVALLSAVGLLAQMTHTWRDALAARFPGTRPTLEAACKALGCRVEAVRAIDKLAVESSGLVRVEKSSVYKLQVTLRNRSDIPLAFPAFDLSLSDSAGKPVARRVLRAADLGVNTATLAAGRELALQATLQAATEPVAGYTIELFYP